MGDGPGRKINLWAFKDSPCLHPLLQQPHTFHSAYCSVISCSQVKFLQDWNWCQVLTSLSWCHQASGNPVSSLQCRMNHGWLVFLSLPMHLEMLLQLTRWSCTSVTKPTCPHMPWDSHSAGGQCSVIVDMAKTPAALTHAGS